MLLSGSSCSFSGVSREEFKWLVVNGKSIEVNTPSACYSVAACLKGNSHQKLSVASMIELLLKSFLVYHLPMFEAWKVPKRPVEVSCDITQHLVEYWTAVGTRTNSSRMRTHTGQYSRLPCMHALIFT